MPITVLDFRVLSVKKTDTNSSHKKLITLEVSVIKEERSQIMSSISTLRNRTRRSKLTQSKQNTGMIKSGTEINKTENKHNQSEKPMKTKAASLRRSIKLINL